MKHAKRLTAAAMAGFIGAMSLFSGVTAYAATGWQQNGSTYYYYDANGTLHKGWLNTDNRITDVLDEIPEMIDPADAVTSVADGDIVFDHVSFSYAGEGGNLSLKDVNLHIKSGQTVGIIGGTGSAKSTLVQLIPRLYDVTKAFMMGGWMTGTSAM